MHFLYVADLLAVGREHIVAVVDLPDITGGVVSVVVACFGRNHM